jgi:hypothetical protein
MYELVYVIVGMLVAYATICSLIIIFAPNERRNQFYEAMINTKTFKVDDMCKFAPAA